MAKKIITLVKDDLDGSEADETVHFAVDGVTYEIDLSAKNASEFRTFMEKYIDAGTRTGRVGSGQHAQLTRYGAPKTVQNSLNREENQRIRAWAAKNGWEMAERGRIPQMIVDAYEAKAPNPQWLAEQNAAQKVANEAKANNKAAPPARRGRPAAAAKAEFTGAK